MRYGMAGENRVSLSHIERKSGLGAMHPPRHNGPYIRSRYHMSALRVFRENLIFFPLSIYSPTHRAIRNTIKPLKQDSKRFQAINYNQTEIEQHNDVFKKLRINRYLLETKPQEFHLTNFLKHTNTSHAHKTLTKHTQNTLGTFWQPGGVCNLCKTRREYGVFVGSESSGCPAKGCTSGGSCPAVQRLSCTSKY